MTGFGKLIVKLYTVASTDGDGDADNPDCVEDDERQDDAEEFGGVNFFLFLVKLIMHHNRLFYKK